MTAGIDSCERSRADSRIFELRKDEGGESIGDSEQTGSFGGATIQRNVAHLPLSMIRSEVESFKMPIKYQQVMNSDKNSKTS